METKHKTIDLDNYSIHYFLSGSGNSESLIFLHPAFSDHQAFEYQIGFFSNNYKVITLDLLGHGLSNARGTSDKIDACAEHIQAIMERENIETADIIGVSMGSLVAQHFALKFPKKTRSLVTLGGYSIHRKNKEVARAQMISNLRLVFRGADLHEVLQEKGSKDYYIHEERRIIV